MAGTSPAMTMWKGCWHAPILQYLSSLFTLRLSKRPDPLPPAARSTSPLQGEVGSVPRCAVTSSVSFVSLGCAAFLVGCAPSPLQGGGPGRGSEFAKRSMFVDALRSSASREWWIFGAA